MPYRHLATMREAIRDWAATPRRSTRWRGRPGDRPLGDCGPFRPRRRVRANVEIGYQRNGERYQFLRWGQGAFDDSRWCRRAPASCTRSTSKPRARGDGARRGGLPRHLCRYRLAHDDGQRPGRIGLGCRRNRGGSRDAGQPVRCSSAGGRLQLTGEIQPGVAATDVVLTVTEMLRKHGVVGEFVDSTARVWPRCRWPTARRWAT